MVSFRFHIVSIVAVFLALALGIGMGVTVIDKATVDLLQQRLDAVRNEVNAANQRSDQLQRQAAQLNAYGDRSADYIVNDRLSGKSVVTVAVRGTDEQAVNNLGDVVTKAGGRPQGRLWFTDKDNLDEARDATQLQSLLGTVNADPPALRQALLTRVSAVLAGAATGEMLKPLVDNGFLDWDNQQSDRDISKVTFGDSLITVVSTANPAVPNDQIALPLVRLLVAQPARRVVAAEPGREPTNNTSGERAVFLQPIRDDNSLGSRLSTVDNLETDAGQVATVLALSQLAQGRTGAYGVAASAEGPIPNLNP